MRTQHQVDGGLTMALFKFELVGFEVSDEPRGSLYPSSKKITLVFEAPDRDTGEPRNLELTEILCTSYAQPGDVYRALRRMLQSAVCHEVDELIKIDGKRAVEPHVGDR